MIYSIFKTLLPTRPVSEQPERIVLIRPCCIGDVVLATATLKALRRGYPNAHLTWAVGDWSRRAIEHHDLLDALLDTGPAANPAQGVAGLRHFTAQLRAGQFDLAISLVRSPWMSLAVALSGIPHRVGLDSGGRGFGYTMRVPVDPAANRHEAEIYLDAARALGLDTSDCYANLPVEDADLARVRTLLTDRGIEPPYVVVNPAGGSNPGMAMASKRWPEANYGALIEALASQLKWPVVLLAGPDDGAIIQAVQATLPEPVPALVGALSFGEIAALATLSSGYIGNDTGLTHLAAAAGARTVMILGPSDPARYGPFTPDSLALWKPYPMQPGGVSAGVPAGWAWAAHGIGVEEAFARTVAFLGQ